jgi:SAM-dependent methyltransferase
MKFTHPGDSHLHSLQTLNQLYEYDDFMASIRSMVDLGCGSGDDLAWWATRTTRDDVPEPLNIRCTGIDLVPDRRVSRQLLNVVYATQDFEQEIIPHPGGFDVLWCHDAFQYCISPLATLSRWWHMTSTGGMLALAVPVTQRVHQRQLSYELHSGCYYHHTLVSLMHMLAMSGWNCRQGFFKQTAQDVWIHAVVYKSSQEPLDPKTTSWHDLSRLELLPESADRSIYAHGYLRQQDLILPWIDKSLAIMSQL